MKLDHVLKSMHPQRATLTQSGVSEAKQASVRSVNDRVDDVSQRVDANISLGEKPLIKPISRKGEKK